MMMSKKRLIAIVVVMILATMLCGFSLDKKDSPSRRFTTSIESINITIITDNETGVQYLAYRTTHGTGLTRLEAADVSS